MSFNFFKIWELLDSSGSTVASLIPEPYSFNDTPLPNNDWHRLGSQNLERVNVSSGNLDTTGSGFTDNAKSVYGMALELSDFVLSSDGVSPLDSSTAASIVSMRLSVPALGQTASKTVVFLTMLSLARIKTPLLLLQEFLARFLLNFLPLWD